MTTLLAGQSVHVPAVGDCVIPLQGSLFLSSCLVSLLEEKTVDMNGISTTIFSIPAVKASLIGSPNGSGVKLVSMDGVDHAVFVTVVQA